MDDPYDLAESEEFELEDEDITSFDTVRTKVMACLSSSRSHCEKEAICAWEYQNILLENKLKQG